MNEQADSGSDIKFLSVDDSFSMRRVIGILLKRCGITQHTFAKGGREAIELIRQEQFDVILCDWNMPDICGLDVVRIIRKFPTYAEVPILMCTSERFKREVVVAISAGANNYIVKPFEINIFRQKLIDVLAVRHPAFVETLKQQAVEAERKAMERAERKQAEALA